MLRAVLNREVDRYEIHRGIFYVQIWGGDDDWWHLYPEHALRFLTPERAIETYREYVERIRDQKKEKRRLLKEEEHSKRLKYRTYRCFSTWFW